MYNESAMMMVLNTLTSTHPGSGTELSFVDLPIQREGHTGYPKIEASTLKGCLRNAVTEKNKGEGEKIDRIFGLMGKGDYASAISITDSRLLFFPVKSVKGVFGWVTCPTVIKRFLQDYKLVFGKDFSCNLELEGTQITKNSRLVQEMEQKKYIMLEDYTYQVSESAKFGEFVEKAKGLLPIETITQSMISQRAVLLEDDDFTNFVKYSTEVNTRIKISSATGTVDGNALFTEEYLPPECVLYSLVFFQKEFRSQDDEKDKMEKWEDGSQICSQLLGLFPGGTIQIGADSTLSKGLVEVRMYKEGKENGTCAQ